MITIQIQDRYQGYQLEARGHAGYDTQGRDIVCAGVSALIWTMGNYVIHNSRLKNASYTDTDDFVKIGCDYMDISCRETIKAIEIGLVEMQERYPQCIKIIDL